MTGVLAFGFPNPFDLLGDVADAVLGVPARAANEMFQDAVRWLVESILGALGELSAAALGFFWEATEPELGAPWFSGADSTPYGQMVVMALPLLLAFFLVGIIHGVVKGDPAGMVRMAFLRLPGAVLAMAITVAITDVLLDVTDEMSRSVLGGSRTDIETVTQMFADIASTPGIGGKFQFLMIVFGLVGLFAAVILVIELFVRAGLIYIVVALSPLIYAAAVWASMRGAVRKMAEIGLALILSKFVIALALSLSVAAIASAGSASGDPTAVTTPEQAAATTATGSDIAQTVGVLVGAVVMFGIAAFMPFVLFKLVPIAEGALVAQGIKSGPLRAGMQGGNAATMAMHNPASRALRNRGTGSGGRSGSAGAAGPTVGGGPGGGGSGVAGAPHPAVAVATLGAKAAKSTVTDTARSAAAAAHAPSNSSGGGNSPARSGGGSGGSRGTRQVRPERAPSKATTRPRGGGR